MEQPLRGRVSVPVCRAFAVVWCLEGGVVERGGIREPPGLADGHPFFLSQGKW